MLTPALINLGWRGGHFFPVIFSGVSPGLWPAILTGADPVFCVAVCTASTMGAVMRQPVMVVGLLLMCFPLKGIVCMIIAAAIAAGIPLPAAAQVARFFTSQFRGYEMILYFSATGNSEHVARRIAAATSDKRLCRLSALMPRSFTLL